MRHFFAKVLLGSISFAVTAFIFLNAFEVAANKDIPIANSIQPMAAQTAINKIVHEFNVKSDSRNLNSNSVLDDLDYIEIPSLGTEIHLENARKINELWYTRPSLVNYIELNFDNTGNAVDYLIYTRASNMTIPDPSALAEGSVVSLYSKNGIKSDFIVAEKRALKLESSLIVAKTERRQIVMLVEDDQAAVYYGYSLTSNKNL